MADTQKAEKNKKIMNMKKVIIPLFLLLPTLVVTGCANKSTSSTSSEVETTEITLNQTTLSLFEDDSFYMDGATDVDDMDMSDLSLDSIDDSNDVESANRLTVLKKQASDIASKWKKIYKQLVDIGRSLDLIITHDDDLNIIIEKSDGDLSDIQGDLDFIEKASKIESNSYDDIDDSFGPSEYDDRANELSAKFNDGEDVESKGMGESLHPVNVLTNTFNHTDSSLTEGNIDINELFIEMIKTINRRMIEDGVEPYTELENGYEDGYLDTFYVDDNRVIFVADNGEKVIGYLSTVIHDNYLYLDDYCVSEKFRGYGIGSNLIKLSEEFAKEKNLSVAFPYKLSCGLAGGDWTKVEEMLNTIFTDVEAKIYKLGE